MMPHRSPRATVNETSSKTVVAPNSTAMPPALICVMRPRSLRGPLPPLRFGESHRQLVPVSDKRHAEQKRLLDEQVEPSLVRARRGAEPELAITLRLRIDERTHSELLREATQLSQGCRALHEIDEVHLNPSLGEEPLCLSRLGALPRAEDLYRKRHPPLPTQQPAMRTRVAQDEAGNDEDPHHNVDRHELPTLLQHVLVRHRLACPLPTRLVRMKERLVRLDGGDGVSLGRQRQIQPVVGKARQQECEERGDPRTPKELERLEPLEWRVLPCAAERRDPSSDPADGDDHQPRRQADVALCPPNPIDNEEHGGEPSRSREELYLPIVYDRALHVELHWDEILRLILDAEKRLPELRDRALDHVYHPEEDHRMRPVREVELRDTVCDHRDHRGEQNRSNVLGVRESLVRRVLEHPPGGRVRSGEEPYGKCERGAHPVRILVDW